MLFEKNNPLQFEVADGLMDKDGKNPENIAKKNIAKTFG